MPNEKVIYDSPEESTLTSISTISTISTISDDDSPPSSLHEIISQDSSAEPEEVIVRGKGRPRKDGLPNNTSKMGPPPTPSPKFKRYYSASVRTDQNPVYYLKWHHELPKWAKDRLVVYVYRLWPALKMVEDMNGELDTKYIDKLAEPPRDLMELQDRYGAGDYQLVVNDDVQEKRTIAELWIKEGFRDVVHFPPTDRRIDDVDNVDLEAQENKSYIQYLKSKGKLPEQQTAKGREADMAEATALKEMTNLMRDVITSKKDDRGTNDTTATVVKEIMGVMGEVNRQASSVMENAYKKTQDTSYQPPPPVQDPIETLDKVLSVMDKIRPAASGDSETIKLLLSQMNKQQERFEELMKEMKNGSGNGVAVGAAQANPLATTSDTIKTVVELVTTLGFKAPGAAAMVSGGADGPWYKDPETIQTLFQYGSQMVSSVAQALTTKMQLDARQQQQQYQPQPSNQFYQPPPPQAQTLPLAQVGQVDPTIIQPDPTPTPEITPEQQAEMQDFYQFMGFIHEPLMNHIDQALGGDRFAEWLIDSKRDGAARYQQIKIAGPENMMAGLRMYQPLWMELEPKQSLLPQFIEEFMTMEERRAEEEAMSLEEEGEETATGD